jgi:hypothetical protein
MCPARSRPSVQTRYARCAASRSPVFHDASPDRPDAPARVRWSSATARSMASRACLTVAGTSPRASASAARYIWIIPGRRANSFSSRTTIPSRPGAWSHRSASRSQPSTPSNSPLVSSAPTKPAASTGRTLSTSSGMASSQPRIVASCLVLPRAGMASSTRSAGAAMSVNLASTARLRRSLSRGRATRPRRSAGMKSLVSTRGLATTAPPQFSAEPHDSRPRYREESGELSGYRICLACAKPLRTRPNVFIA